MAKALRSRLRKHIRKNFWSYVKQYIKLSASLTPTFDSSSCTQIFYSFFRSANPSKSFEIPSSIPALGEPPVPYDIFPPSYHQITKTTGRMKASGSPTLSTNYLSFLSKSARLFAHILQLYLMQFGSQGKSLLKG